MHHGFRFLYTTVQKDLSEIPPNVKLLVWGIFIYTIGWGLVEPFVSIYIKQMVNSYFLVGVLMAAYFVVTALFSAPLGDLTDKISPTKIIPWMMLMYPFIALLYFLGSVFTGLLSTASIFLARTINGFSSTLWVAVEVFVRQNSPQKHTAGVFGLYFTVQHIAFVLGLLISMALIRYFGFSFQHIGLLFFGLLVTPVISAIFISRIPVQSNQSPLKAAIREVIEKDRLYGKEISDFKKLENTATTIILQGYFMTALAVIGTVFLPLLAENSKFSLFDIAALALVMHLPFGFSFLFSEISDRVEKFTLVAIGFLFSAVMLVIMAFFSQNLSILLASALILGTVFAIMQPTVNALLTEITPLDERGEMTGIFHAITGISNAINTLLMGTLASLFGINFPFIFFAGLFLLMAIISLRHGRKTPETRDAPKKI